MIDAGIFVVSSMMCYILFEVIYIFILKKTYNTNKSFWNFLSANGLLLILSGLVGSTLSILDSLGVLKTTGLVMAGIGGFFLVKIMLWKVFVEE